MKITVVIPFFKDDFERTVRMLNWIQELDKHLDYDCIFVFRFFGFQQMDYIGDLGRKLFRHSHFIIPSSPPKKEGWPHGPNYLFQETIKDLKEPFLWLEPDCVPLCPGWLDKLNQEYFEYGVPFMGTINSNENRNHLSGVAVYPKDARSWYERLLPSEKAFDMVDQGDIMANTHDTMLIHNFWGKMGLPPTFKENLEKGDPENTLTIKAIRREAVLFHRCKDNSLINLLLKEKRESLAV